MAAKFLMKQALDRILKGDYIRQNPNKYETPLNQ